MCGLKWSPDDREVASGGNDNQLYIWGLHSTAPVLRFSDHTAAVKAIAWSPHQHGLLASGGGTADRCIRFWNTATGSTLSHYDTGEPGLLFDTYLVDPMLNLAEGVQVCCIALYPALILQITVSEVESWWPFTMCGWAT